MADIDDSLARFGCFFFNVCFCCGGDCFALALKTVIEWWSIHVRFVEANGGGDFKYQRAFFFYKYIYFFLQNLLLRLEIESEFAWNFNEPLLYLNNFEERNTPNLLRSSILASYNTFQKKRSSSKQTKKQHKNKEKKQSQIALEKWAIEV